MKRHYKKIKGILACVVILFTVFSLTRPAITMGKLVCEKEEHTHTNDCYNITEKTITNKTSNCNYSSLHVHVHSPSCYNEDNELICGYADYIIHEHNEDCYQDDTLVCELEEIKEHVHNDSCYDSNHNLICTKPQIKEHKHNSDCYDEDNNLICGFLETSKHEHNEDCFTSSTKTIEEKEPICTKEEHEHTENCYKKETDQEENSDESINSVMALSDDDSSNSDDSSSTNASSIAIESYITDAKLYYRTSTDSEWTSVTNDTTIPGNADLRLEVDYENLNIDQLLAANCTVTFNLPSIMRNPKTNGTINSGNTEVGTITANGNQLQIVFDQTWLSQQKTDNNTTIDGDFYVESKVDLSQAGSENPGEIRYGDVVIQLKFDTDVIAKYGEVKIEKSTPTFSQIESGNEKGDYLSYTLTVTAGPDGMPNVKVVDEFTNNGNLVASKYLDITISEEGILNASTATTVDGKLVWTIGNMAPNEVRTLTYKVKLVDAYTSQGQTATITNQAKVYSKDLEKKTATSEFSPKATANMSKKGSVTNTDDQGNMYITYYVWIKADEKNTYPLKNVCIKDALDGSIDDASKTEQKYLNFTSYVDGSFYLYKGGSKDQNSETGLTDKQSIAPTFTDNKYGFVYKIGTLSKGETYTLSYQVKVEPNVYAFTEGVVPINNRVYLALNASTTDNGNKIQSYMYTENLSKKVWDRKIVGDALTEAKTISLNDFVYEIKDKTVSHINDVTSFNVPIGSYQYQVVANEAGNWDVSSASMSDQFQQAYMQYVGYVQINAYEIGTDNKPTSDMSDTSVINNLSARTPVKTVYLKVDEQSSFSFEPKQLGFENGNAYAYLLTYYAKPVNVDNVTQVVVTNEFSLGGTVGINGTKYTLTPMVVDASVVVAGSNSFNAQKLNWYYDPTAEGNDWSHGSLYWVIKVDGNTISKDTYFRDTTLDNNLIRSNSLVGLYIGNLGTAKTISDFDNMGDLMDENLLTKLDESYYSKIPVEDSSLVNNQLIVKLNKSISLDNGKSLYIIVRSAPQSIPVGDRETKTYKNKLESSFDGKQYVDHNTATEVLCGSNGVFKELNKVVKWDGTTETVISKNKNHNNITNLFEKPGIYVTWQIQANYVGNLNGRYRFEETIPEGMELVYVRYFWNGGGYTRNIPVPTTVKLTETELSDLGKGWVEHTQTIIDQHNNSKIVYYYQNGNKVIWDVDGLYNGYQVDQFGVEYQIACRVTDPDVLLGGIEKTFDNKVTLKTAKGNTVSTGNDSVSIKTSTISKTGIHQENDGSVYPFEIKVNPNGQDLLPNKDKITVIDELGENLTLDSSSIVIKKTGMDEVLSSNQWTASVNGQTLSIEIPDNLALTITYNTNVNAAPGQEVKITNKAYWEGYDSPEGGSFESENFSYTVGGTVSGNTPPTVTVEKSDSTDMAIKLTGATFTLQEATYNEQSKEFVLQDDIWSKDTGTDGKLTFGNDAGQQMSYNTIYCLTETKAPDGYVLDAQPHYFVIAKQLEDKSYPPLLEQVKGKATVYYQSPNYIYQAYNHKGQITVEKKFIDIGGRTDCSPVKGTYNFGLYENAQTSSTTQEPSQTISITYNESDTSANKSGIFKNLDLQKTYYVYELDDQGKPIIDQGIIGNNKYLVSYDQDDDADSNPNTAQNGQTVIVTNQSTVELPETGGSGTWFYTIGGLILVLGSLILLYKNKLSRKEA